MYLPALFREDRLAVQHKLIRSHPLGLLITAGPSGLLANPIPFLLDAESGERGTLLAHMARANGQWRELQDVEECLVVFQGPQDYITPSWYETKRETGKVVPTWNYATVHVWGRPRVIDDDGWLRWQVERLTRSQEDERTPPWHVGDAPETFISGQIKGIIGLEIPIARSEGKWKVSQNRPLVDRAGVVLGLRAEGAETEAMACLVEERGGLGRSPSAQER
jgi:transcriptional regulator